VEINSILAFQAALITILAWHVDLFVTMNIR
jgi:hypothetical protein